MDDKRELLLNIAYQIVDARRKIEANNKENEALKTGLRSSEKVFDELLSGLLYSIENNNNQS